MSLDRKGKQPFIGQIVGYKNTGKTTFMGSILTTLKARGYRVAVIKHDAHGFEMDHHDTDTYKHREAGAEGVAIVSPGRTAVLEERTAGLDELLGRFDSYDCILLEGFKEAPYPKLVMIKEAGDAELLGRLPCVAGAVCWPGMKEQVLQQFTSLSVYGTEEAEQAAHWIAERITGRARA
ncbi:molybdopterin-guanine dinucleotide biosynthesis protein B [Paenibacillus sp. P96]|uniref:Molybdopterin-guanine dinucleotide biosynthesis protein B n=1 Tax=Paenibacillus zeirhizosphaerae TaxID=2987519 RepID=A0ABT9FVF9_9BACL|nr:molybdopterin-guanine dinucleotide biosynthesis protein B [Paenibacillus sp. P96]MDP4098670.1 molybdopterin-guanine dinucleotide biosynthesis protein B [Paenibacillus sp. P96]